MANDFNFNIKHDVNRSVFADQFAVQGDGRDDQPAPGGAEFNVSPVERIRAIKAVRAAVPDLGLVEAKSAVEAAFEAVGRLRNGDPVGTLRKDQLVSGRYAFSYAPGKWLLIDTNTERPAYKTTESSHVLDWELQVEGAK